MGVSDNSTDNSLFFERYQALLENTQKTPPHFSQDFNHSEQITHPSDTQDIPIGRFAPSPTGPLHFGSLVAATASYLNAKSSNQGKWLLRIEDVDTQRKQRGATKHIISTLETYGFSWDHEIVYQSQRGDIYSLALDVLKPNLYPCSCTRKELQALSELDSKFTIVYPGICREGMNNSMSEHFSWRLKTESKEICFNDLCQPEGYCQNIEREVGDFVLKRRDGLFAYQLAVVVDDALQQVNQVVRGADLFDNTPRQIFLQQLLGFTTPLYLHVPVAVTADGKKLSKQNGAPEVSTKNKRRTLTNVLEFLGQTPPHFSEFFTLDDCWKWAIKHWDSSKISKVMTKYYEPTNDE